MRVLVTGGAGYIGSVVSAQLITAGHEVVVVDDLSTGHADAVPPGAEFHQLEIADLSDALGGWGLDAVVHCAAKSVVGESVRDPARYWHSNVEGTLALLDAMRANGVLKIVFSSTAATYGDTSENPIPESAATRPTSPYGASKLASDLALANYSRAYDLAAVSLRYFNVAGALVTGERQGYGERHAVETHLVPLALRAAQDEDGSLSLYGTDYPTPDGTCVRDYIHVVDLAEAHLRALQVADSGRHEIVNLGSGSGSSVREVIDTVRRVTGRDLAVHEEPRRTGDPAMLVAANDWAASLLGWRPIRGLDQMISDAWTLTNTSA
ncbi:MAG: UDP-glucose 4-epimerase GalE [Pseudonocardiales bacterium]|nr:MAG: UDP-glucose 4-epimerase GalE [Pseudonocardiales bacterium]